MNTLNYQIYLLEGLNRWNRDQAAAALSAEPSRLRTYTGVLVYCVNTNYEKASSARNWSLHLHHLQNTQVSRIYDFLFFFYFGMFLFLKISWFNIFSGELIGIQYLLRQNNEPLQDMHPNSEETWRKPMEEDEGYEEFVGEAALSTDLVVSVDNTEIFLSQTPVPPLQPTPAVPPLQSTSAAPPLQSTSAV